MCDELSQFDGCERLIVIAVGLDADVAQATHEKRSQLYRALTRAHLMVIVVNEFLSNGWFTYHRDLELKPGEFDADAERRRAREKQGEQPEDHRRTWRRRWRAVRRRRR